MVKVEEVPDVPEEVSSSESGDEMPNLENADTKFDADKMKLSRSEKKARKAMQSLGMKPVSGVLRVTVKRSKNVDIYCVWFACCSVYF